MDFTLNDEQKQLADSVKRFIEKDYDFETRKKIVASAEGWSPQAWATMAELGLLGLAISEDGGGFGGSAGDLMAPMQELGAGLVVEPFLATVLAARLIDRAGTTAVRQTVLPGVVDGSVKLALASTEADSRFDLSWVSATATRSGNGWVINGHKVAVLGGPVADKLVVSARTSGKAGDAQGVSLFVVDRTAAGVTVKTYRTQDSVRGADIGFANVTVGADALVGPENGGLAVLEEAVDFATVLLCAEAVGTMKFACDTTLDYLKTRKQFGTTIGSFQALQHRMVDMIVNTEQSRSIMYLACAKVDGGAADAAERRRVVSAAKVKIAESARHVSQESVQLHGGMGMTVEMKVSHAFKRLTMIQGQFGDADWHLERFGRAS